MNIATVLSDINQKNTVSEQDIASVEKDVLGITNTIGAVANWSGVGTQYPYLQDLSSGDTTFLKSPLQWAHFTTTRNIVAGTADPISWDNAYSRNLVNANSYLLPGFSTVIDLGVQKENRAYWVGISVSRQTATPTDVIAVATFRGSGSQPGLYRSVYVVANKFSPKIHHSGSSTLSTRKVLNGTHIKGVFVNISVGATDDYDITFTLIRIR